MTNEPPLVADSISMTPAMLSADGAPEEQPRPGSLGLASGSASPFEAKKRERLEKMKAAWNAQEMARRVLKQAKRDANKLAHITPKAHSMLERFYLTCPLAKKEVVSLAVMELIDRKPSNSELLQLWEKHRGPASPNHRSQPRREDRAEIALRAKPRRCAVVLG